MEQKPYEITGSKVCIDTGIKDLAILSEGTKNKNIKTIKNNLNKLKFTQKQLSKKIKGIYSRDKQRKNLP